MAAHTELDIPAVRVLRTSTDSSVRTFSLKSHRAPRFAEATAVNSPIEPNKPIGNPFLDPPTNHYMPQPQPSDVGFGYLSAGAAPQAVEMEDTDASYPPTAPKTPLKSALKSHDTAARDLDAMPSPTFREETTLEKQEELTDKEQRKDLKAKFRVRMAKIFLRGVNFSCSLIVLSMLASTFSIFNATKSLPPRNNLPAWSPQTPIWPQVTLLVIASLSLFASILVIIANFRGGYKKAEKVGVYYTTFSVAFFMFSVVMWLVGAGVLNSSKNNSGGIDIWAWSCKDNTRKALFSGDVSYALVCRLQNWSLVCCIIEIVIETFTILVYGIVFYRFYSKRKLRKSMAARDSARHDLYLSQLRAQSAPNTPRHPAGYGPVSPRDDGWTVPPGHPDYKDPHLGGEESVQYAVASPTSNTQPQAFALQAAPRSTQRVEQNGLASSPTPAHALPGVAQHNHTAAAPGERQYEAVPIPGEYASPMAGSGFAPR